MSLELDARWGGLAAAQLRPTAVSVLEVTSPFTEVRALQHQDKEPDINAACSFPRHL